MLTSSKRLRPRVRLLLYNIRPKFDVDGLLDARPPVVGQIDASGQYDEAIAKILASLEFADVIFDVPQLRVDCLELFREGFHVRRVESRRKSYFFENRQLGINVAQLGGIGDPLGFDFENRDLVYQLADCDRRRDAATGCLRCFHRRTSGLALLGRGNAQSGQQWLELLLINPPSTDGALVNRLADLRGACRAHRPVSFME